MPPSLLFILFVDDNLIILAPFNLFLHTDCSVFMTVISFCKSYKGCAKPGVYGTHCNMSCPGNCKNQKCQIENGTCFTCEPGWIGIFCTISMRA